MSGHSLTQEQITRLCDGAKGGRHGVRDFALLLVMYRHGLRVSEATGMRRADFDLSAGHVWVQRLKGSLSLEHPVDADEMQAVNLYLETRTDDEPWLFVSERDTRLTRQAVNYIIANAGERAGLGHVHPGMLRHSCGQHLADRGVDISVAQDYMGHREIRYTAQYVPGAQGRFFRNLLQS